jgi:hypothetical protein
MMEKRMKDMIHKNLESGRRITQSKGNYQEFIMTLMSAKCSLWDVFFFHTDLVVARTYIQFGELLSTTQFIQEVFNEKNGEFFFDCEFVEGRHTYLGSEKMTKCLTGRNV